MLVVNNFFLSFGFIYFFHIIHIIQEPGGAIATKLMELVLSLTSCCLNMASSYIQAFLPSSGGLPYPAR